MHGHGLVRKDTDPKLARALHLAHDRTARRFDLAAGDPARLQCLESIVSKIKIRAACRLAAHAAAMLLAVLEPFWHQHNYYAPWAFSVALPAPGSTSPR